VTSYTVAEALKETVRGAATYVTIQRLRDGNPLRLKSTQRK
jgi:hypothetical protein